MYAIIEDSGTQIQVQEGDVIKVSLRELGDEQATLTFDRVVLVSSENGEAAGKIGQPYVEGASVTADILGEKRGEKIRIVKFNRRKNYKRTKGHRQDHLEVKVTAIQG